MDREGADIRERTANMPKTHPNYGSDFQTEAVNLLLSSGRPLKRVAEELGVSANSLRTWRNRALGKTRAAQAASAEPKGRSEVGFTDPAAEIRRLQREVEYLRRQREILKKAVSILSEDPQSGMR
jgi:transposase